MDGGVGDAGAGIGSGTGVDEGIAEVDRVDAGVTEVGGVGASITGVQVGNGVDESDASFGEDEGSIIDVSKWMQAQLEWMQVLERMQVPQQMKVLQNSRNGGSEVDGCSLLDCTYWSGFRIPAVEWIWSLEWLRNWSGCAVCRYLSQKCLSFVTWWVGPGRPPPWGVGVGLSGHHTGV